MGYGYTDEAIKRLTPDQALDLIEKTRKSQNMKQPTGASVVRTIPGRILPGCTGSG